MRAFTLIAGAVLLGWALPAAAVPVNLPTPATFSASTVLPGTNLTLRPELAGAVLQDKLVDYSNGAGVDGQVEEKVIRETGAGTLDFYWRVIPQDGGDTSVEALRIGGFSSFITDADSLNDGPGAIAPDHVLAFVGGSINFLFSPEVGPSADESSTFFFLKTTATLYNDSGFFDLATAALEQPFGANSTFAPTDSSGAPEPAGWAMMLLGFGGLGAAVRRRRRVVAHLAT